MLTTILLTLFQFYDCLCLNLTYTVLHSHEVSIICTYCFYAIGGEDLKGRLRAKAKTSVLDRSPMILSSGLGNSLIKVGVIKIFLASAISGDFVTSTTSMLKD